MSEITHEEITMFVDDILDLHTQEIDFPGDCVRCGEYWPCDAWILADMLRSTDVL